MPFEFEYDVYAATEMRDGTVFKTKKVTTVWLPAATSEEEKLAVAREHGGYHLQSTTKWRS